MGVMPCGDYVVGRKGNGRGKGRERGEARHRKTGRGTVKYSKTRCRNGREKTRLDHLRTIPGSIHLGIFRTSVDRNSIFPLFSPNILQTNGDNEALLHCVCAIGCWLCYRRITLPSEKVNVENRQCVVESDNSLNSSPPRYRESPKGTRGFTGMRLEKASPGKLRQSASNNCTFNVQPREARGRMPELPPAGVFPGNLGGICPHLHLIKIGHRPLVIPAILLQTVYREFHVQARLLA